MKTIITLTAFLFLFSSCGTETKTPTTTSSSKSLSSLEFNSEDSLLMVRILVNRPSVQAFEKAEYLSLASEQELRAFVGENHTDIIEGLDKEEDIHIHVLEEGLSYIQPTTIQ